MSSEEVLILALAFCAVAALYSSVGHAGASGYIAVMALMGIAASELRPTALTLNLVVGIIGLVRFGRAGHIDWRTVWPLVLGSAPMAWFGARLSLPEGVHEWALAVVLGVAAYVLWRGASVLGETQESSAVAPIHRFWAWSTGSVIGFIAGITGTGGAIFLTPLLLFLRWAPMRGAAGISIAFVWINSLFGLAGLMSSGLALPKHLPLYLLTVAAGAWLGTHWGVSRLPVAVLRRCLAVVLLIAAFKLLQ